jgi:OOP family OmpA-OmpF porin
MKRTLIRGMALVTAAVWIDGCAQTPQSDVPVQQHAVFFPFESAELTPSAHEVVHLAATQSTELRPSHIGVTGYAAAAGPVTFNQKLSEARAATVADALVANGVPRESLRVAAKGEAEAMSRAGIEDRQVKIEFLD